MTAGRQELLYASVRSAPAAWHVCVHDDWKPLNLEMSAWIEDKFSNDRAKANMKEYIEVRGTFFSFWLEVFDSRAF